MSRLYRWAVLTSIAWTSIATAQVEQDTATARTLFHEGIECADAGDNECASDRLRRSFQLRPSPVVAFNLAQVEAEAGNLVMASEKYRLVQRSAEGALAAAAELALQQLLPRLAHVTIHVETDARVELDGSEMQPATWGIAMPLDPGAHRLSAFRGELLVAEDTFSVTEGEHLQHTLEVPAPITPLRMTPVDTAALDAAERDARADAELEALRYEADEREEESVAGRRRRRTIAFVALGVLAAVALGVVVAFVARPGAPEPTDTDLPPVIFR